MIKTIMAQNTYSIKEIGIGIVRYFTISRVVVSIKQEPIKQEKEVIKCKPPLNERIGINNRKKNRHSENICSNKAITILQIVLAETSKKH